MITLWLRKTDLLGMNRRNAEYIMRCNPRSAYPLVDDKVLTKRLAEENQIPTPPLYHIIRYHGEIAGLKRALEDRRQFVVKPARGSGGSGILLITDRNDDGLVTQAGEPLSWEDLVYHVTDILSGIHSLEGLEDRALIEALVYPDPVFAEAAFRGVPDIRIVVYRGIPVMGMLRLPTRASDGKANLHRGAMGVGIDFGSGTTLTAVHHSEIVTHHPDTGRPVGGMIIPHWESILHIAARAFDVTGLGYLGADFVIDWQRGPLLLELNSRPGLQIQMANQAGLLKRLALVDQAPPAVYATPAARVAWSLENFKT